MTLVEILGGVEDFKSAVNHRVHWKKDWLYPGGGLVMTSIGNNGHIIKLAICLETPQQVGFPGRRREVGPSFDEQIEVLLKEHFPDATPGEWKMV